MCYYTPYKKYSVIVSPLYNTHDCLICLVYYKKHIYLKMVIYMYAFAELFSYLHLPYCNRVEFAS